jgi:hypothetical protein
VLTVEIFKTKRKRDPFHPHSFLIKDVFRLLKSGFNLSFLGTSDWIGIRRYVKGLRECTQTELIVIAEKREKGVRPIFGDQKQMFDLHDVLN